MAFFMQLRRNAQIVACSIVLIAAAVGIGATGGMASGISAQAQSPTPMGGGHGQIAFYSERDGNAEIYLIDSDGTNVRRLTNNPATDYFPVWSPDGSQFIFMSDRNKNWNIFAANDDGSNVRRLTANQAVSYTHR